MKTFLVFSMAVVASQAFFLPNDFFTDIAHRMSDLHHAVRPQGQFSRHPQPPFMPGASPDATHQRMGDLFDSLTPEEQAALKNHLFGQRFPRPLPASHQQGHQKFSDDQIEAARAKWNSMTPEQQKAFREKYQKPQSFHEDGSEEKIRRPRSIPEAPVVRSASHRNEHQKMGEEKLKDIRERWAAMTPEEREAIKNGRRKHFKANETPLARPQPRQFQAIQPIEAAAARPNQKAEHQRIGDEKLQIIRERWDSMTPQEREDVKNGRRKHFKANEMPLARPQPRQLQAIQPLVENMDAPLVRSRRSIQPIEPASNQGPLNPGDHRRPNLPNQKPPMRNPRPLPNDNVPNRPQPGFVPIRPFSAALNPQENFAAIIEKMKGMTKEEQIKFLRELYPQGLPIRPLKGVIDPNYSRPIQPVPAEDEINARPIQPYIFPIASRPLLPLEIQPIFPLPAIADPENVQFLGPIPLRKINGDDDEEETEEDEDDSEY